MRKSMVIAAGIGLGVSGGVASAATVYQTGFEDPGFVVGSLSGQDLWSAGAAIAVGTSFPAAGVQSVEIDGSLLEPDSGVLVAAASRQFDYSALVNPATEVFVGVDARLDGPNTDSGSGSGDDLLSINMDLYNSVGDSVSSMIFSSAGKVWAFNGDLAYQFETSSSLGQYTNLRMRVDIVNRLVDYIVDGVPIGSIPFGSNVTADDVGTVALSMLSIDDPSLVPGDYAGYFDNLNVMVVPEPGSLGLLLGAGIMAARRRRD